MSNSKESHESSFTNSQKRSIKAKRAARKSKSPENSERRVKAKRKSKSPDKKKENSDPIGDCSDEGFLNYDGSSESEESSSESAGKNEGIPIGDCSDERKAGELFGSSETYRIEFPEKENSDLIGDCRDEGKAIEGAAAVSVNDSSSEFEGLMNYLSSGSGSDCYSFLKFFSPISAEPYVRPERCERSEPTGRRPFRMEDYVSDSDDSWGDSKPVKEDDAAWCFICKQLQDVAHLRSCIKANGKPLMPWESLGDETTDLCSPKA